MTITGVRRWCSLLLLFCLASAPGEAAELRDQTRPTASSASRNAASSLVPAPPRADASSGVPPAPADPFADFAPTRALKHWDRERGFVKATSEFPLGDLYLCWNRDALYLGLYAIDIVEAASYRNSSVPKIDRALWTVAIGGREIVRARLGAGREPLVSNPAVRVENLSGLNLNVRNIATMELPAKLLSKDQLKAGDTVELDCTLLSHGGAYRMEWKGTFTLRE